MINNPPVKGYFDYCEQLNRKQLGYMYCAFMRDWIFSEVSESTEVDKFIVHFERDELTKVDVVLDRKIVKSFDREEWLNPTQNLDSKKASKSSLYLQEYIDNEDLFMKYVRYCPWVVPVSDSSFVIAFSTTVLQNE